MKTTLVKLNRNEARFWIEKLAQQADAGKNEDTGRLLEMLKLMDEAGEINLQQLAAEVYHNTANALNSLAKTKTNIARMANAAGFTLVLKTDNYKRKPLAERRAWLESETDEATSRVLDKAYAALEQPPSEIENLARLYKKNAALTVCFAASEEKQAQELIRLLSEQLKLNRDFAFAIYTFNAVTAGEHKTAVITQTLQKADLLLLLESPAFFSDTEIAEYVLHKVLLTKKELCCAALAPIKETADRNLCSGRALFFLKTGNAQKAFTELKQQNTRLRYAEGLAEKLAEKCKQLPLETGLPEPAAPNLPPLDKLNEYALPYDKAYIDNRARHTKMNQLGTGAEPAGPNNRPEDVALHLLDEWLEPGNKTTLFALLGQYGMGKTFTARMFASRQAEKYKQSKQGFVPLYFDLRDFAHELAALPDFDIWKLVDSILHRRKAADDRNPLTAGDIRAIWEKHDTLLIFDGLDEVIAHFGQADLERIFITEIFKLAPGYRKRVEPGHSGAPRRKMLLTCRTDYFKSLTEQSSFFQAQNREHITAEEDYTCAILLPFNEEQVKEYLGKTLKNRDPEQLYASLKTIHNLPEIISRPVLLDFITEIIDDVESIARQQGNINTALLYDRVVVKSFDRDESKHEIPVGIKMQALEAIAAFLWQRSNRRVAFEELEAFLSEFLASGNAAMKKLYYAKTEEALYKDLRNATLLVRSSERDFGFSHTSVQEYFLARFIIRCIGEGRFTGLELASVSAETCQFALDLLANLPPDKRQELNSRFANSFSGSGPLTRRLLFELLVADRQRDGLLQTPEPVDISGLTFNDFNLAGTPEKPLNLAGLQARNTRLYKCNWQHLNLDGADFTDAALYFSKWQQVNLNGANFTRAQVQGQWRQVWAEPVQVAEADFEGTEISLSEWAPEEIAAHPPTLIKSRPFAGEIPAVKIGHTNAIQHCIPIGEQKALSCSNDNTLILWNLQTGKPIHHLKGHNSYVRHCTAIGEQKALSCSDDNTLILWNLQTGKPIHHLKGHNGAVIHCTIIGEQKALSCSHDNTLILWNLQTGKPIQNLKGHNSSVNHCTAIGEQKALSCSYDNTLILWNLQTGKPIHHLKGHNGAVIHCTAIGEQKALSCSTDKTLILWNLQTGKPIHQLKGHNGSVYHCTAIGEQKALSCGADGQMLYWNLETGEAVQFIQGEGAYASIRQNRLLACSENAWKLLYWKEKDPQGESACLPFDAIDWAGD